MSWVSAAWGGSVCSFSSVCCETCRVSGEVLTGTAGRGTGRGTATSATESHGAADAEANYILESRMRPAFSFGPMPVLEQFLQHNKCAQFVRVCAFLCATFFPKKPLCATSGPL